MKEYFSTYSKEQVFILDEDGDNYKSFEIAIEVIKELIVPSEHNFKQDFLDAGNGFFIKDRIKVKIACSNWDGTELRVDKDQLSEFDMSKVRQWAEQIYEAVHKKQSPR